LPIFNENFGTKGKVHRKPIIRGKREGDGMEFQNAFLPTDQQDWIIRGKRDTDSNTPIIREKQESFLPIFEENSGLHSEDSRRPITRGKREEDGLESHNAFLLTDQQDLIICGKRERDNYTPIIRGKRKRF
jgi:hypothetical protein